MLFSTFFETKESYVTTKSKVSCFIFMRPPCLLSVGDAFKCVVWWEKTKTNNMKEHFICSSHTPTNPTTLFLLFSDPLLM